MDTQNQNQNVQPDYNFIVNQPVGPKKKISKKTIVLIVLLILLVIAIGLSVFASSTQKVERANQPVEENVALTETSEITVPENEIEVVLGFFELIEAQKYREAFAAHIDKNGLTANEVISKWGPYLINLDLEKCEVNEKKAKLKNNEEVLYVVARCSAGEDKVDVLIQFNGKQPGRIKSIKLDNFDLARFRVQTQ